MSDLDKAMVQAARQIRSLEKTIVELQAENAKLRSQLTTQADEAVAFVQKIAKAL